MIMFEISNPDDYIDGSSFLQRAYMFAKALFRKEMRNRDVMILGFDKGKLKELLSHDRAFVTGINEYEALLEMKTWRDTTPAKDADTTIGPTQVPDAPSSSTTPASPAQ